MGKIYIATKNVVPSLHHLYLVYDPDDNPLNQNEFIIRGGPAFSPGTNIVVEVGSKIVDSEDNHVRESETPEDRYYTDLTNMFFGLNIENVWAVMKGHAQAIHSAELTYDTGGQNSNSVISSVLQSIGITYADVYNSYLPDVTDPLFLGWPAVGNGLNSVIVPWYGYQVDSYRYLLGNANADIISIDVLYLTDAHVLDGGDGNDLLIAGAVSDKLYGGSGNDTLFGGGGADHLYGNGQLDHIADVDVIVGGSGADMFYVDQVIADLDGDKYYGNTVGELDDGDVDTLDYGTITAFGLDVSIKDYVASITKTGGYTSDAAYGIDRFLLTQQDDSVTVDGASYTLTRVEAGEATGDNDALLISGSIDLDPSLLAAQYTGFETLRFVGAESGEVQRVWLDGVSGLTADTDAADMLLNYAAAGSALNFSYTAGVLSVSDGINSDVFNASTQQTVKGTDHGDTYSGSIEIYSGTGDDTYNGSGRIHYAGGHDVIGGGAGGYTVILDRAITSGMVSFQEINLRNQQSYYDVNNILERRTWDFDLRVTIAGYGTLVIPGFEKTSWYDVGVYDYSHIDAPSAYDEIFLQSGGSFKLTNPAGTDYGWAYDGSYTNTDVVYGTAGSDTLTGALVHGDFGNDTIAGTGAGDSLFGDDGNDTISGNAGNDDLMGGNGNDILNGGSGDDTLFGGNGNDTLNGGDDEDTLHGGAGDDTLNGDGSDDYLYGGYGNDELNGGGGSDYLYGEGGNDTLDGGEGNDFVYGGDGDDTLIASSGNDSLYGEDGDDVFYADAGASFVHGGSGNNIVHVSSSAQTEIDINEGQTEIILHAGFGSVLINGDIAWGGVRYGINDERNDLFFYNNDGTYGVIRNIGQTLSGAQLATTDGFGVDLISSYDIWAEGSNNSETIYGFSATTGNEYFEDRIKGNAGSDLIYSYGGNDTVHGGDGDDEIHGGEGDDILAGDNGNDTIYGDDGDDTINGGYGNDVIYGGSGLNTIYGDQGDDLLYAGDDGNQIDGGEGDDELYGGEGDDYLSGGEGGDVIHGGQGSDSINGSDGNDVLYGDDGDDYLYGDDGNDTLIGGSGYDALFGGNGDDILHGGDDGDTLYGEEGNDTYIFNNPFSGLTIYEVDMDNTLVFNFDETAYEYRATYDLDDTYLSVSIYDTGYIGSLNINLTGTYGALDRGIAHVQLYDSSTVSLTSLLSYMPHDISGTSGNDIIYGASLNDYLYGDDGDDVIYGGDGSDVIAGDSGDDILYGQAGQDHYQYNGLFGKDTIIDINEIGVDDSLYMSSFNAEDISLYRSGDDLVISVDVDNQITIKDQYADGGIEIVYLDDMALYLSHVVAPIWGTAGVDTLTASVLDPYTVMYGFSGNDILTGGIGDDEIYGGQGDDVLSGEDGADYIIGDDGDDILYGDTGDDFLYGGAGYDQVYGGDGADILFGSDGGDDLYGGSGADIFVFDTISDYSLAPNTIKGGFDVSSSGSEDILDIYYILDYDSLNGDVLSDFVSVYEDAGDTVVSVDKDGLGTSHTFTDVVRISGVTGQWIDASDMIVQSNLIVE